MLERDLAVHQLVSVHYRAFLEAERKRPVRAVGKQRALHGLALEYVIGWILFEPVMASDDLAHVTWISLELVL